MRRASPPQILLFALGASLSLPACALRLDYTADLAVERNDNLLLSPTDPVSLTLLRPGVSFEATHDSSAIQAHATGRIEWRRYGDRRFDDATDAGFDGRFNWIAIPERLSFGIADTLSVQPVNTLAADTPGNRQQVNVLAAGPTLLFGDRGGWRGAAELRYVRSTASVTDEFDARRGEFALRALRDLGPTTRFAFNLQRQRVDFDNDVVARDYTRSELFARFSRTLRRTDYAIDAGYSRLDYRRAAPGLARGRADPMLRATLGWRPGESHRFELRLSRQFSDVAANSLAGIDEAAGLRTALTTGDTVVNASPYSERRGEAEYTYASPRWTVHLTPHADRLRYQDTRQFDQNGVGSGFEANWRARRTLLLGVTGSIDRNRYVNLDRTDDTRRVSVFARCTLTRHLAASFTLTRYARRSTAPGQDADQNAALLALTWRNR